jgi:hypothetical protein
MTKEELAAKIVLLVRTEAPEMAWPDVDTAVLMAAHEVRLGHHTNPPAQSVPEPEVEYDRRGRRKAKDNDVEKGEA